jgi:hypothetical protein
MKKKKKKKINKIIIPKTIKKGPSIITNEEFICIACEKKINLPGTRCILGNGKFRHKLCGPSSAIWAEKFPSAISFSLYLYSINAVEFFEQYLKNKGYTEDKGYTEERFFKIKNAPQNFLKHLNRHLKTRKIETIAKIKKGRSRLSKSGGFKSIRHLLEEIFAKNKNITRAEVIKQVKIEFPDSKLVTEEKPTNFSWYVNFIVKQKEFKCITPPKWAL